MIGRTPTPDPSRLREGRIAAERRGRRAETVAAWWLRLHGWRILARRVRTRWGEVDLVARRGRMLAMIEVKARSTAFDLSLAIDERRLERVMLAASAIAPRWLRPGDDVRVDVILIGRGLPKHLPNVLHA